MRESVMKILTFAKSKASDENLYRYKARREMLEHVGKNHNIVVEMNLRLEEKVKLQQREIDWLKDQVEELKSLLELK